MSQLRRLTLPIVLIFILIAGAGCSFITDVESPGDAGEVVGASSTPLPPTATYTPAPTNTPVPTSTPVIDLNDVTIELIPVVLGLPQPLDIRHAGDGSGRLFVATKAGLIYIIQDGELVPEPFLDISAKTQKGGAEQGLLGLAFHPDYASNGKFFVNYSMIGGDTVIARYTVSSDDPNRADPESEQMLMIVDQPYNNHNGGNLVFGPDGYLYVGLGDGGSSGDPDANGQDGLTLLGTMLRLDVNTNVGYDIPPDNPFIGNSNVRDEVWAIGLRNPWRYTFDRVTGDMYIGDVGQRQYEEINFVPADRLGGQNFGWNITEGFHCYAPSEGCDTTGIDLPVVEYSHDEGCSVTGGYVYRGVKYPSMWGVYLFGDYCSGKIWGLKQQADGSWQQTELLQREIFLSTFGEDESGELYIADYATRMIYRVVAIP